MEREYVWEADYGERHQLKEALKKLLHEQDASSLQALLVFANNNIYNLELFVAALYADPKKGHIEKMMHVFEEARLVQRKDITISSLMNEMGNRRFNAVALENEHDVDIMLNGIFFFCDRDTFIERGYIMRPFGKEKQIFISHSSKDKGDVEKLVPFLNGQEIPVWFDQYSIPVSGSITNSVQEGIDNSSSVLFWVTKNFLASSWCKFEMTAFIKKLVEENGKVFMVLDDEISTKELPVFLRDIKYIKKAGRDIYEIAGEIIKVLKQELQSGYF